MTLDAIALNALMTRLIHTDAEVCVAARQEIQSWPFEIVLEILARYWPEGYDLPRPEPRTRWERLRRKWLPPSEPPAISAILDLIVIFHAQVTTSPQVLNLVLSVLARTEARERELGGSIRRMYTRKEPWLLYRFPFIDIAPTDLLTRRTQNRLLTALGRLVSLVTPIDCDLSPRQCDALLMPLEYPYRDVNLTLNILVLLSCAGEKRHISTIERVAKGAIDTDNGQRIRAAANACLEQIRARYDKKQQAQSLLRAADNKTLFPEEVLLRPLEDRFCDSPDELLRPSANDDAER